MSFFAFVIRAVEMIVIVDAISSWIVRDPRQFPRNITSQLTAPLYAPIRKLMGNSQGGVDWSPLILIVLLNIIANSISRAG